ncbi:MAG: hypothetical protein WBO08_02690, partial [Mycobacterium sp.]
LDRTHRPHLHQDTRSGNPVPALEHPDTHPENTVDQPHQRHRPRHQNAHPHPRTRTQNRTQRTTTERKRNATERGLELAENDSDPPPF